VQLRVGLDKLLWELFRDGEEREKSEDVIEI